MIRDKDPGCCGGRLFMIAFCDWCGAQQQIPKTATDPLIVLAEKWNWVFDFQKEESRHFHSRQCRAAFENKKPSPLGSDEG